MRIGEIVGEDGKVEAKFDLPAEVAGRVDTFCATHNMPFDEFFEKAMLHLMRSMDRDKHVLCLLELQFKYNQRIDELANVSVDFGKLVIDLNLLHLALDMLGVHADTSLQYLGWNDSPNATPPEGLFCRDSFSAEFDRVVTDGTLVQRLEYIRIVRAWVDDWNTHKGRDASP